MTEIGARMGTAPVGTEEHSRHRVRIRAALHPQPFVQLHVTILLQSDLHGDHNNERASHLPDPVTTAPAIEMERAFGCPGPGGFGMSTALSAAPGSSAGHRSRQPRQAAQPAGSPVLHIAPFGVHEQG